jgi:hypothetical protein
MGPAGFLAMVVIQRLFLGRSSIVMNKPLAAERSRGRPGQRVGAASASTFLLVLPEIAKPLGRKFAISNRMLDVLVAEIVLQRPSIHTLIG